MYTIVTHSWCRWIDNNTQMCHHWITLFLISDPETPAGTETEAGTPVCKPLIVSFQLHGSLCWLFKSLVGAPVLPAAFILLPLLQRLVLDCCTIFMSVGGREEWIFSLSPSLIHQMKNEHFFFSSLANGRLARFQFVASDLRVFFLAAVSFISLFTRSHGRSCCCVKTAEDHGNIHKFILHICRAK